MDIRDDARDGFAALFGHPPAALWSAPGSATLIGDHTGTDGLALSFAINRRAVVALGLREDRVLRVASTMADEVAEIDLSALDPGALHGWSAHPLAVAWALSRFGADLAAVPGADLLIESDVPVGAGLSSSSAVQAAIALALNDVWRLGLTPQTLAEAAQRAQSAATGAPASLTEHAASLLARDGHAVTVDGRTGRTDQVPLDLDRAGLVTLAMATEATRTAGSGMSGDDARLRHAAAENQRVLAAVETLRTDGPAAIGHLLDESHHSMRDGLGTWSPEGDLAVEVALASGAIGARATGRGGAAIALVPRASVSLVQVALDGAFSEHGYSPPDTFVVMPSSAATREP